MAARLLDSRMRANYGDLHFLGVLNSFFSFKSIILVLNLTPRWCAGTERASTFLTIPAKETRRSRSMAGMNMETSFALNLVPPENGKQYVSNVVYHYSLAPGLSVVAVLTAPKLMKASGIAVARWATNLPETM